MATPSKVKKTEPQVSSPYATTTRVTRLRTPKKTTTADEKRMEREKKKADDAAITKKKATARKQAIKDEQDGKQDEKQSEDEKHVRWEDELSSREASEQGSEVEGEENDVDSPNERAVVPNFPEESEGKIVEVKKESNVASVKVNSEGSSGVDTPHHDKKANPSSSSASDVHTPHATHTTHTTIVTSEKESETAAPLDEVALEAKRREDLILEKYNQQWAVEALRRQKVSHAENERRLRIAKKIDIDFQRSMAEEFVRRDPAKASRQQAAHTNSPLLPATYTMIKIESDDSDDEPSEFADQEERIKDLETEITKFSAIIKEKEDHIARLESNQASFAANDKKRGEHVAEVLVELEASSSVEKKKYEDEVHKLRERVRYLEAEQETPAAADKRKLVEDLADQLAESKKDVEEQAKIVNIANETFENEMEAVRRQKQIYDDTIKRWEGEKVDLENKLREAEKLVRELQDTLHNDKKFKEAVQKGVRDSILKYKLARRQKLQEQEDQESGSDSKEKAQQPRIIPFSGVPVSKVEQSTAHQGQGPPELIDPPPSVYFKEDLQIFKKDTEKVIEEGDEGESEEGGEQGSGGTDETTESTEVDAPAYETQPEYEEEGENEEYEVEEYVDDIENDDETQYGGDEDQHKEGEDEEPENPTDKPNRKRPHEEVEEEGEDEIEEQEHRYTKRIKRVLMPLMVGALPYAVVTYGFQIAQNISF